MRFYSVTFLEKDMDKQVGKKADISKTLRWQKRSPCVFHRQTAKSAFYPSTEKQSEKRCNHFSLCFRCNSFDSYPVSVSMLFYG